MSANLGSKISGGSMVEFFNRAGRLHPGFDEARVKQLLGDDDLMRWWLRRLDERLASLALIHGGGQSITIDCDAVIPAHLMEGFERREEDQIGSRVCGTVSVDPANPFRTLLVKGQKHGAMSGKKVLAELKRDKVPVYGIAALEQMRQEGLVPGALKGQALFAWGDVLRGRDGGLYVRCLYWFDGRWDWDVYWLGRGWSARGPAAVSASSA